MMRSGCTADEFTVPEKNEDIRVLLKGIGQKLGVAKENIYVQDYKESFCHYMFNQPKELWQYEAALFYCDEDVIRAYMLRELKNSSQKSRESFGQGGRCTYGRTGSSLSGAAC